MSSSITNVLARGVADRRGSASYDALVAQELESLSAPLWEWLESGRPVSARVLHDDFALPDVGASVQVAIRNSGYEGASWYGECHSSVSYGSVELPLDVWVKQGASTFSIVYGDVLFVRSEIEQFVPHCSRPYVVVGLSGIVLPSAYTPNAWITGAELYRKRREESCLLLSAGLTKNSKMAARVQEPVGLQIEARFHFRLVERRIDQTIAGLSERNVH